MTGYLRLMCRQTNRESLILEIKQLACDLSRPPLPEDVESFQSCISDLDVEEWNELLRDAGVIDNFERGRNPPETLLADLRRMYDMNSGGSLEEMLVEELDVSIAAYQYWFGSVSYAAREIGIDIDAEANKGEMLADIRRVSHFVNRYPKRKDMRIYGSFSPNAYECVFDSFNNAVSRAVVTFGN